ncbi:MAG: hypothetical protein HY676_02890 [Chloroflexi bacterium]|nr:hypothetical protein [Chloroflexota bacterium]
MPWRHLWHLLAGLAFPVASYFLPRPLILFGLGAVTLAFLLGEGLRRWRPRVNRFFLTHLSFILKENERRSLTGATYFLIGSLAALALLPQEAAAAALIYTAVADPAAAVVGQCWGRHRLWEKSLEGSLAFLGVALALGAALGRSGLPFPVAGMGAAVATAIELLPLPLDDNLSVPLASAGAMSWLL